MSIRLAPTLMTTPPKPARVRLLLMALPVVAALTAVGLLLYRQSLAPPLFRAIYDHDPAAVDRLLQHGASPNAADGSGDTALSLALSGSDMSGEMTRLNALAFPARREEIVRLLLQAGADPNSVAFGKPALFQALEDRSPALTDLLLTHGANPNVTCNGSPALITAVMGDAQLHSSGTEDAPEMTQALLVHGATAQPPGQQPLIEAVRDEGVSLTGTEYDGGYPALLEVLLAHGAAVNGHEQGGTTALAVAAERGSPADVRVLLAHGASPGLADWEGRTPLQVAREAEPRTLLNARSFAEHGPHPPSGAVEGLRLPQGLATGFPAVLGTGQRRHLAAKPVTEADVRARYAAVAGLLTGAKVIPKR